jgi:hypothetical protein
MDPLNRNCRTPRCPHPALPGGACRQCAGLAEQDRNDRRSWKKAFYASPIWRAARLETLLRHPTCQAAGCLNPSVDVDHDPELIEHDPDPINPTRLVAYCHPHHSAKTATDHGFGSIR